MCEMASSVTPALFLSVLTLGVVQNRGDCQPLLVRRDYSKLSVLMWALLEWLAYFQKCQCQVYHRKTAW